jgi:hypothetical protein
MILDLLQQGIIVGKQTYVSHKSRKKRKKKGAPRRVATASLLACKLSGGWLVSSAAMDAVAAVTHAVSAATRAGGVRDGVGGGGWRVRAGGRRGR